MSGLPWVFDDGGRAASGFKGETDDCVTRAVAIATGRAYRDVYDELFDLLRATHPGRSPRQGIPPKVMRRFLSGFDWTPTMTIGSGCTVHTTTGEVPGTGIHILRLSGHVCALVEGVVRDSSDPTRRGTRCVYGYWTVKQ